MACTVGAKMTKAFPGALVVPVRRSVRVGEAQLAMKPLRLFPPDAPASCPCARGYERNIASFLARLPHRPGLVQQFLAVVIHLARR
ncbi:hypothetical protein [Streptomyces flavidovirens]|uniref:Transposase n=1 Tax=Streptomyces flavidovirens TaxID=67298 RepID=A0ABW6RL85_9ACTN